MDGSGLNSLQSSPIIRFVELMPRVFFKMMMFMKLYAFSECTGITFVDSMMIPVCHNVRRYFNKVFFG
nr:transposase [Segatella oris]